jgi:hypothetical protein
LSIELACRVPNDAHESHTKLIGQPVGSLDLFAEFDDYSALFFSYKKLVNNIFIQANSHSP